MVITEENIMIRGTVSIGATISYTNKNEVSPTIILIMGTGKTNRDGNEKSFKTDLYKKLAELFVSCGFVCVRYDKRGTYQTGGNYRTAGLSDLIDDALSVIQYTKALPYTDEEKVIICGHSEGAMIATLLTQHEKTAGLLLLGGAAISLKDSLLYQNRIASDEFEHKKGLMGALLRSRANKEKSNAKVEAMFRKCSVAEKDTVFFGGAWLNAKWIREHGSYTSKDYTLMLNQYEKPVLAITGTADLSVDYKSLDSLSDIPHIEVLTPQRVNHILRKIDDDNSFLSLKKQYVRLAKKPMSAATEKKISEWLRRFV